MKKCTKCGEVKSLEEFYLLTVKGGRSYHCSRCKPCNLAEQEVRRRAAGVKKRRLRQDIVILTGYKTCSMCGESKLISDFFTNNSQRDGSTSYCKECHEQSSKVKRRALGVRPKAYTSEKRELLGGKECVSCSTFKPFECFHKNPNSANRRVAKCKDCTNMDQEKARRAAGQKPMGFKALKAQIVGVKECPCCLDTLPIEGFNVYGEGKTNVYCARCTPRVQFEQRLRKKYNLTVCEYAEKLYQQNFMCQICGDPLKLIKNTHVDHNHTTGKVRGVLCPTCNWLVGMAESPKFSEVMRNIDCYLLRYAE